MKAEEWERDKRGNILLPNNTDDRDFVRYRRGLLLVFAVLILGRLFGWL